MTTRTKRIKHLSKKVDQMADGLGYPMDPKIKPTVVALMLHGFPTVASCEGHLDHGYAAPWVMIEPRVPKGLRGNKKKAYLNWQRKKLEWRVMDLLTKFYRRRLVAADVRLHLDRIGYGIIRLTNEGNEAVDILSEHKRKKKLRRYQQEMKEFTKFLLRS